MKIYDVLDVVSLYNKVGNNDKTFTIGKFDTVDEADDFAFTAEEIFRDNGIGEDDYNNFLISLDFEDQTKVVVSW